VLAIVLAAGRGRRVGGPKALLDLEGSPALQRVLTVLRAGGITSFRVVLGSGAEQVAQAIDLAGVEVVHTPDVDLGQTASLKAGLAVAPVPEPGFLLHPVDLPLLDKESVQDLLGAFELRPRGIAIVLPSVNGRRGHPALFAASLAEEFLALENDAPAHRVVRRNPARVHHVELDRPWLVRDLDRPEDVEAARAELRRRGHA